ncbi:MAG: ATP-binding cassette domain-containing protein, partial [Candidatus Thiodiazotropha sp.]
EPTSALDSVTRAWVLRAILDYCDASGAALLVVTHHTLEAQMLAQRFLQVRQGVVIRTNDDYWEDELISEYHEPGATPLGGCTGIIPVDVPPTVFEVEGLGVERGRDYQAREDRPAFALEEIGLTLRRGESIGLIGETGSGKTTLVTALAGLIEVETGRIRLGGKELDRWRGKALRRMRRHWQAGFQDASQALNPHFTVEQILVEPARLHDYPKPSRVAMKELLDEICLPGSCLGRTAGELSFGQKQRLALARSIWGFPELEVLLLDEPLTGLDADAREIMIAFLLKAKAHLGLLIASHDLGVIDRICDEVLVLQGGRIVDSVSSKQHEFVTDYAKGLWATAAIRDPVDLRRAVSMMDRDNTAFGDVGHQYSNHL